MLPIDVDDDVADAPEVDSSVVSERDIRVEHPMPPLAE